MKPQLVLISLLLPVVVVGCATNQELQALRADMTALERQRAQHDKTVEQQLRTFSEQLVRFDQSRRDLAQTITTIDELRIELQRLRGDVEETRHRLQSGPQPTAGMRDVFATKLAELDMRLGEIETRLNPTKPPPPALSASPQPSPTPSVAQSLPAAPTTRPPTSPPPAFPTSAPPRDVSADLLYERAEREYRQGNYEVAIVLFKQFLRQHSKAPLAGSAQYWIGESLYAQKQFEAAIVAFDEVIRKYPRDEKVPAALLKQGYAFAELKDLRNARFFLQQVEEKYPKTPEARQATEKLKQL